MADQVTWQLGTVESLGPIAVDIATMTGNVAQVFLTDDGWTSTLVAIRDRLAVDGHLVFEARDPAARAWEQWTRPSTFTRTTTRAAGPVESWVELLDVAMPFVSFRWTYRFLETGDVVVSDSTLRFRTRYELESSLATIGYGSFEVFDAPDRPGEEFVFVIDAR